MWEISKDLEFCYGHRVYVQELDAECSLNAPCKCRHWHGHQAKVVVNMMADKLNKQGMVVDFVNLNWAKKFFDDYIDHKTIIDINDPLAKVVLGDRELKPVRVPGTEWMVGKVVDCSGLEPATPEYEHYDSFFVVDFVPTSENLSEWAWRVLQCKMADLGVFVSKVEWYETPKSKAVYMHVEPPAADAAPAPPSLEEIEKYSKLEENIKNRFNVGSEGLSLYKPKK